MSKFEDAMNNFSSSDNFSEDIRDAFNTAYSEDFSSYEAKVFGMESQLADKDTAMTQQTTDYSAQISSLKSANYDLLRAVPKDAKVSGSDNSDDDLSGGNITIDDLFGTRKS